MTRRHGNGSQRCAFEVGSVPLYSEGNDTGENVEGLRPRGKKEPESRLRLVGSKAGTGMSESCNHGTKSRLLRKPRMHGTGDFACGDNVGVVEFAATVATDYSEFMLCRAIGTVRGLGLKWVCAADLVQKCLCQILKNGHTRRPPLGQDKEVRRYLSTCLNRVGISQKRSEDREFQRQEKAANLAALRNRPTWEKEALATEIREDIDMALMECCDARQREAFRLSSKGKTLTEIGEAMEISSGQVARLLAEALARLRQALLRRGH